jgi:hypothetical protein
MNSKTWQDEMYERIYSEELTGLEKRKLHDKDFSSLDVARTLKDLYVLDGSDWLGRGEAGDITSNATIAAYENFLARLGKE